MPAFHDVKKVGVTFENKLPYLMIIETGKLLAKVVEEICEHYHLSKPTDFTLYLNMPNSKKFLDQQNWSEIQNGVVLELVPSLEITARKLIKELKTGKKAGDEAGDKSDASNTEVDIDCLKQLSEFSEGETFAKSFICLKGLDIINNLITSGKYSGTHLFHLLKCYRDLRDHNLEPWKHVDNKFINIIATCTNSTRTFHSSTILLSLDILESIIMACPDQYSYVEKEITPNSLIPHLQSSEEEVQTKALAVLNALFVRGDVHKKRRLGDHSNFKAIRNIILTCIIHRGSPGQHAMKTVYQLHRLQCMLFNLVFERSMQRVDPMNAEATKMIKELRQIAFDTESDLSPSSKRQSQLRDFKKLGFQNPLNPLEDLCETPPGMLCLQNMTYFAKQHQENYTKVVLENSCRGDTHELPFATTSSNLTKLICNILKVGQKPMEDGQSYHPLFFSNDQSIEELYCVCIQLFNKTWKEMKATHADFHKVLEVVEEQLLMSLESSPTSFEQLRNKLSKLPYHEVTMIWQRRQKDKLEWSLEEAPIRELQAKVEPGLLYLIRKHRLNYLQSGSLFPLKTYRRQDKFMFCRLAASLKCLHYDECDEHHNPSTQQLSYKMAVSEIKDVLVGKDCPHVKKKANATTAFSITTEESFQVERADLLNFIAPNEEVFETWIDGLNVLLDRPMTTPLMETDLERLMKMEMKLRLLDAEGLSLPKEAPPIPRPPPHMDFPLTTQ